MPYLTAAGIESCLVYLATTYPAICQLIPLPNPSVEGRTSRAVKIASGGGDRHGVLLIGGVHAREVVNPDLLVSFALDLCQAYTNNTGLTYGPKSYTAGTIKLLVDALDIFIFPLVNPDGRVFVQAPAGDPMWRKNRALNPGQPCRGVDLNRNYDFLWSSGIGTTAASCSDIFKGPAAFSEPETQNVRSLLDSYPNIECMIDVHSYMQLILHPFGDDENQTRDPAMNFLNPAYNGLRGTVGDTLYKEYIPVADLDWFVEAGERVRDAIAAVRGRLYTVQQSVLLYPTSGTSKDYAYSRHFVDASKRKVYAYTLETGLEFQPVYAEALEIISEVSAGVVEFLIACMCTVETVVTGTVLAKELDRMRIFRDAEMLTTVAGRRYLRLLQRHSSEILDIFHANEHLRGQALDALKRVVTALPAKGQKGKPVDNETIRAAEKLLSAVYEKASGSLRKSIETVRKDLRHFSNKTIAQGMKEATRALA